MKAGIVLLVVSVAVIGGCRGPAVTRQASIAAPRPSEVSEEPSLGASVPADDPSLPRADAAGRTPADVAAAVVRSLSAGEWKAAYSDYATPEVGFETARREWEQAAEKYEAFTVRETRVTAEGSAWVRVTYSGSTSPVQGDRYTIVVDEPGEWWPLSKIDGRWRVHWMPRQ